MWKLNEIYAQNICAFRELHYHLQQGVTTLIFGDNKDNESQGSNGSGKSALIECIAIGITGSPLRKIKNEEIINDNSDECLIELQFGNDSNNEVFTIERKLYRKGSAEVACYITRGKEFDPDEAVQHSVDAYNKYILEMLGLTKDELYNNFILSKHKYQDFLSCSDKDKKEIINRFSNGNLVDKAIEGILSDKAPVLELMKRTDLEFAGVEGRIAMLAEQIEKEESSTEQRAKSKVEKIAGLEESIVEKRSIIRQKADELGLLDTQLIKIKEVDSRIQQLENGDFTLEDYLSGINKYLPLVAPNRITDWDSVIKAKKDRIHQAEEELAKWDTAFCLAEKKVNEITATYNELYKEYEAFTKSSLDKAEIYEGELRRLNDEYIRVNKEIESLKKTRKALSVAIECLSNKLAGIISCPSCGFEFVVSDRNFDVEKGKCEVEMKQHEFITLSSCINETSGLIDKIEQGQSQVQSEKRELLSQKTAWTGRIGTAGENVNTASYQMESARRNQSRIADTINALQQDIDSILRKVFDEAFELIDEAYKAIDRKINAVHEDVKAAESSIDTLENTIKEINANTGSEILVSLKASLKEYRHKSSEVLAKKAKVELELKTLETQEQNFVEFKTYLSNTKINALSQITNEFLENIGSDIRIRFSGYTTLKSGQIREKISISLVRNGLDCGSFGKFSSGETSRVNLATILAMQKLINSNCEIDKGLDLLILDEILSEVDEQGLSCMLDALNRLNITAWVVTHGLTQENYPYTLKIIKENGESNIK